MLTLIGATGTGKSSLLLKLITQDAQQGRGLTVLDPHGDLIDEVISRVPDQRLKDVVLVDPSDSEYPIGLNLLSAYSDVERIILSSDLVALFRRFATTWGDQMTSVLANAINAILESKGGGTLIDLRRFLVESSFRNKFLQTVDDPNIIYYWKNEFPLLRKNTVAPILTRLDTFLRPRIVRNMMAQKEGLDFIDILGNQKILLVKLAQGLIGEENSYLLGTLFVAKLHQAAQARQNISPEERKPFYFYIDEFQNFITPSMSSILSGARKYGLGLILAHQDLDQLARRDSELTGSVLSNPAIRACFRCGDKDASKLENGFSYFDSTDLQSLSVGQAIVRVGQKDHDFNLSFALISKVKTALAAERFQSIRDRSRAQYAQQKTQVEASWEESLKRDQESGPLAASQDHPSSKKEKQTSHRKVQTLIQGISEKHGFKSVIEEATTSGHVDIGLTRGNLRIACEVSETNSPAYEVKSILKRFDDGYDLVIVTSPSDRHLATIEKLAAEKLPPLVRSKTFFVKLLDLDAFLATIPADQPSPNQIRGYSVTSEFPDGDDTLPDETILPDSLFDIGDGEPE